MPVNSTFKPYDLGNISKNKKVLNITKYLGVDYGIAQLQVADNHAVDLSNIVFKDRVNQKRHGWQQLFKMTNVVYWVKNEDGTYTEKSNPVQFNGMWAFVGEDNETYVIAHIGKTLFRIDNIGKDKTFLDIRVSLISEQTYYSGQQINVAKELANIKTQAFYGNKRLYILGGNKYYVLTSKNGVLRLKEVEDDEDTYIPTTTIGIVSKNTVDDKENSLSNATSLDDVNLMTQYRKNKLITGIAVSDDKVKTTPFYDYELDSCVSVKNSRDINNIKITINSLKSGVV